MPAPSDSSRLGWPDGPVLQGPNSPLGLRLPTRESWVGARARGSSSSEVSAQSGPRWPGNIERQDALHMVRGAAFFRIISAAYRRTFALTPVRPPREGLCRRAPSPGKGGGLWAGARTPREGAKGPAPLFSCLRRSGGRCQRQGNPRGISRGPPTWKGGAAPEAGGSLSKKKRRAHSASGRPTHRQHPPLSPAPHVQRQTAPERGGSTRQLLASSHWPNLV